MQTTLSVNLILFRVQIWGGCRVSKIKQQMVSEIW